MEYFQQRMQSTDRVDKGVVFGQNIVNMESKAVANSTLVLRLFTLLFTAACIVVLLTDNFTLNDGEKLSFKNVKSYRYVLATAIVGAAYAVFQLPFAIYFVYTRKRLIRNEFLPTFDFYGDKIISFILASGVGAGFAVTYELKDVLNDLLDLLEAIAPDSKEFESTYDKFFYRGYIAIGLLGGGFICLAILSILSSINRTTSKGFF